jgi:UDP-glucuronate decarboxylase
MRQLAEMVIEMTAAKVKIDELPRPADDPSQRRPNIDLAKEKLGWEPKITLKEGLAKAIAYFKSIDLTQYRKPTDHTAHKNTDAEKKMKK